MLPTPINAQATPDNSQNDPANNNRQNRGTGFTNLDSILNANQGAGARIGQAVGNNIAGQADSVKAGIQSSQDQFNTDKNNASSTANNSISAGNQYVRQASENNDAYSSRLNGSGSTTPDYSAIGKNLSTAAYNGPTTLNNADQLSGQASNVSALGRLAGTADGQSQLLRTQVAQNGQYSTGQNSLDSLLLGTSGQQYLQPARAAASQVGNLSNNAILNSTAQANATKSAIDNQRVSALQGLQSSLTGTGAVDPTANPNGITGLETDATKAASDYTNKAQRLQQLISGKDTNDNIINPNGKGTAQLTDSDKALLQHMSDYGVANGNLYVDPNNPNASASALGNYAANLTTTGLGKELYTDPQKSAAVNLAKLLGDSQSQTNIAGQNFNKNIQSDTQRAQGQAAVDSLQDNIKGTISDNTQKASDIQRLIQTYSNGGASNDWGGAYNNDTNLSNLNGGQRGDLYNTFKKDTGLAIDDLDKGAANKRLSSILDPYFEKYHNAQTQQQSQLTDNTTSIQNAALQRLLGQ